MIERVIVRRGAYFDPFTLMKASEEALSRDGVTHAAVGMGEPLNLDIISNRHGYDLSAENGLDAGDLVIALRADTKQAADEALAAIDRSLLERGRIEKWRTSARTSSVPSPTFETPHTTAPPSRREPFPRSSQPEKRRSRARTTRPIARMQDAKPIVVGIGTAGDLLPGMTPRTFLHAGPPVAWADMSGPMRGAIIGAVLLEGLASDPDDAVRRAEAGEFEFGPGHERGALGPMVGVISHSMPVWIVENETHGNRAYCNLSEGYGEVLRFGAFGEPVIERLRWMGSVFAPILRAALELLPTPLDIRALNADAVQMGDEVHNRNRAGTSLVVRALAPVFPEVDAPSKDVAEVARFIAVNDYFYLNLSMASGKATADAASGIEDSTIVTAMARNGTEFGLRVSGTGDRWFTAPAGRIQGLYRPGYRPDDANPDVGDSTITETIGLGGFVMAASPAITHFAGISAEEAVRATLAMYEITWSESVNYRIPALGYRGSPLGIDCRKVVETGIAPIVNTGIAHREPGVGVIGGGIVRLPTEPFADALQALAGIGLAGAATGVAAPARFTAS